MHYHSRGIAVEAPAKVNLFLRIAGRREDGFHELDTLMQTISLSDTLHFDDAPDLEHDQLTTDQSRLAVDASNLILRAVSWVRRRMAEEGLPPAPSQRIHLIKRIPIGAGLGGGSADAAAALWALERRWNLSWPIATWRAGALSLGSDVPFCHAGGSWRCTGRGEQLGLLTFDRPPALALLCPPFPAATAAVYGAYARLAKAGTVSDRGLSVEQFAALPWRQWRGQWRNDLTAPACEVVPPLKTVRMWMERNQISGGMSGSGSTFVAVCESLQAAAEVGACFEREFPQGRSFAVEPVAAGVRARELPATV
ncbi:MAG TPA: 4-(cytidine 5'-diphospho)-2-C-methyl-D-erythritol kinase [Planctomycetota bacterium]|nr:4-(cytidine 5'-diphospho)-2-C-methyl-D-erythritol kinase [Planctomycetota bacterium]